MRHQLCKSLYSRISLTRAQQHTTVNVEVTERLQRAKGYRRTLFQQAFVNSLIHLSGGGKMVRKTSTPTVTIGHLDNGYEISRVYQGL